MAYKMLERWQEGSHEEETQQYELSRTHLMEVLMRLNCESAAWFLKFGERDHYWK